MSTSVTRQLQQALGAALDKERQQWKPVIIRPVVSSTEISDMERDREAEWLVSLMNTFNFAPETYALAISIMDRVSSLVKIRPKYLRCVAISCLFLAAKTLEDDEVIPITLDLVRNSQCGCSVSEVLRMELVILTKLNWDIKNITVIDFLHLIHAWLVRSYPGLLTHLETTTPSTRLLPTLTRKCLALLGHADLTRDRPSVVAMALVSLELEHLLPGAWFHCVLDVPAVLQVESKDFEACREVMSWLLSQRQQLTSSHSLKSTRKAGTKSKKRKAQESEPEPEDMYDGIKRLFEERGSLDKLGRPKRGSCASEMHTDADDLHPFVPAVAAV